MKLEFGYGRGVQTVEVREQNLLAVLESNPMEHAHHGAEAVRYALAHPIGAAHLHKLVRPGQKIAIVTSDISRPLPSYDVLPAVLDELYAAGCKKEDITVVFALGSHRKHTEEEQRHLVTLEGGMAQDEEFLLEYYDLDHEAEKYRIVTYLDGLILSSQFEFE